MPNDTSRKPWSLDTAAVITTDRLRVRALEWQPGASSIAGDNCYIEDNNGERVVDFEATGARDAKFRDYGVRGQDFDGFEVATIDNGILYVYYA